MKEETENMEENTITLPTIHMNGTSKEMLARGWRNVALAHNKLLDAINEVEFNWRDYYMREGAWDKAQAEFREAMGHLRKFDAYVTGMRNGIFAGGHKND